ncbi:MAG: LacI family DNA-binding transcriptional regulator [Alteromonadaceae bacterium]|nr:LacI family DNA-binding transcriptional regulator [Alteromonadaceae bacterium]
MATIYEVSELAGVSLSSVSRVLNNHEHVSEKTKIKVNAAMKQLNYRPNSIARSLASNRTDCIGILVSELHGPFYGDMLTGIETQLRAAGKHVIITAGHSDEKSEKYGIDFLVNRKCDALILLVDAISDQDLIELSHESTPFVLLNRYISEMKEKCFYLDNILGGYLATKQLIEQGHKDIAYISGPLKKQDATERHEGHKKALAEFNIDYNEELLYEGDFLTKSGHEGMTYFIEKQLTYTAVACANDEMASGAMKGARDHNIAIPQECSFIGFDNVFFTEYLYPQLSTIHYPITDMAKMSTQWILKNIYKKDISNIQNLFIPELVLRDSVQSI